MTKNPTVKPSFSPSLSYDDIFYEPDYVSVINFYSGIFWIPFTICLFFLYLEQKKYERYPHKHISFLLFCGSFLRMFWFLCYSIHNMEFMLYINRICILFQSTALSFLILMWSRALKVSSIEDKRKLQIEVMNSHPNSMHNSTGGITTGNLVKPLPKIDPSILKTDEKFRYYMRINIIVNCLLWTVMLVTLIGSMYYDPLYNINIIFIGVLCFFEGMFIFIVSLYTGIQLSRELTPVYNTGNSRSSNLSNKSRSLSWQGLYKFFFKPTFFLGLQMQRTVIQSLLKVSTIITFFFLIRSFAFSYRPIFQDDLGIDWNFFNTYGYPFTFYQLPEFIPTLAICITISPKNGICYKMISFISFCIATVSCDFCGEKRSWLIFGDTTIISNNRTSRLHSTNGRFDSTGDLSVGWSDSRIEYSFGDDERLSNLSTESESNFRTQSQNQLSTILLEDIDIDVTVVTPTSSLRSSLIINNLKESLNDTAL